MLRIDKAPDFIDLDQLAGEIAQHAVLVGMVLTSADPLNTVGAVLTRRFKETGDIVRVERGTWGLKEWYPGRNWKNDKESKPEPAKGEWSSDPNAFPESTESEQP